MAKFCNKQPIPNRRHPRELASNTRFEEDYWVKINYRKPDGFWVIGKVITVPVLLRWGEPEKVHHDKAEALAKARYPGCEIVRVTYL